MGSVVFTMMDFTFLAFFFSTLAVSLQGRAPNRPSATTTTTATTATTSTTVAATTVGAVDYDDYMTLAKDLIEADSCPDVVSNGNCEYNATLTSYFGTFDYNGMRVIVTSGVPDHEAEADMIKANPNRRCEKWAYMVVPNDVDKSEEPTDTSMETTTTMLTSTALRLALLQGLMTPMSVFSLDICRTEFLCTDSAGTVRGLNIHPATLPTQRLTRLSTCLATTPWLLIGPTTPTTPHWLDATWTRGTVPTTPPPGTTPT